MDNSRYNIDNQTKAVKQDFANFADFAKPQFEIKKKDCSENSPVFPEYVYKHLPDLLKAGCDVFKTDRQRDVFSTGAIAILSGIFNNVQGLYDGKMVNCNLYCFIVAPPASDKGVLTFAKGLGMSIHRRFLAENDAADKIYKAEQAQYKLALKTADLFSVAKALPTEPITKLLYVPANSSSAAIMRHIQQNDGGGVICETEADTLTNTFKQEWGNFDDLMRKAFHQEAFSYSRKTNNELVEVPYPKIALALSGTPGQASRLLVSGENGLVSRFMFYYYQTPGKWHSVSPQNNINLDAHFKTLADRVCCIYDDLRDKAIEFSLTSVQWQQLDELFASKLAVADADLRSTVTRLGLIVFKIAMVLSILRNEKQLPDDGKIICSEDDFRIAFNMVNVYEVHADLVYKSLLVPKNRNVDNIKTKFFDALPGATSFERKEAIEVGRVLTISERQADNYLKSFSESGLLELVKYGTYRKM